MKTLIGILAIGAIAVGFTGAALACGPGEGDPRDGLFVRAAREGSDEGDAGAALTVRAVHEGSGAEVADAYQYPPILPVLVAWMELF